MTFSLGFGDDLFDLHDRNEEDGVGDEDFFESSCPVYFFIFSIGTNKPWFNLLLKYLLKKS